MADAARILIAEPYRIDKNLGRAYNETMEMVPAGWWVCFKDIDTLFLQPECGEIMHKYVEKFPNTGIFTCLTNRVSPLSSKQLLGGKVSEDPNTTHHLEIAERQMRDDYTVQDITRDISGVLMLISKKTWTRFPFPENKKCLGVDTDYNRAIRAAGLKIYRMNKLYIFHTYRLTRGITYKAHLL